MGKINKDDAAKFWYGRINKHPEDATREEIFHLMAKFANEFRSSSVDINRLDKERSLQRRLRKHRNPYDLNQAPGFRKSRKL
jgi:hypothetical protein